MILTLAWAALTRHRVRTLLAVLGVAVSAAMLLDMVMLSSGMRASFKSLLLSRGFQIRLSPRGTLPFDTDATIPDAGQVSRTLAADSAVADVSPVLGGQVHVDAGERVVTAMALGVLPGVQGDYEAVAGREPRDANEIVANEEFLRAVGVRVGDSLAIAAGYDPQVRAFIGQRSVSIVGRARFLYLSSGARAVALPLETLQEMRGAAARDRASLFMVRAKPGADIEALRARIYRAIPTVSVISIESALREVEDRLSYFRQLAVILGAVSLAVGFLLVTTLVTVSVNERLGEIVVMRAIGVARQRIVLQIVIEGTAIMLVGAIAGLGLGLATAHYLNSILATFPGLPAAIDFFLFQPKDAWTALGLLTVAGMMAGIYPSWRGASLPIASTLREEAVS
jgi:putative ABC transport system permease protein